MRRPAVTTQARSHVPGRRLLAIAVALAFVTGCASSAEPQPGATAGDKIAYLSGRLTVRTALPGRSATWQHHPLITAATALAELRAPPKGGISSTADLVVTDVHLGGLPIPAR
jgi:hypothetical protein